jgi:hypothetical protein
MFLVEAQHLTFARGGTWLPIFGNFRQSLFDFIQVLNAVARKRNVFAGRGHLRNDVIAFPPESFPLRIEGLLFTTKIAVPNGER